ncbi:Filament-like plant protein 1 [Frankliniella fusca]|uniref:Filament-like plant protein 1 n=1 Tax=Frankliniella fusca TaxID=407009 RepID=A0AAE1GTX7_9NEOP|nr:Filament-like plant protein 1 [Frankliniella fusca]
MDQCAPWTNVPHSPLLILLAKAFKENVEAFILNEELVPLYFPQGSSIEIFNINFELGSKRAEAQSSTPISSKIVKLQTECKRYHDALKAAQASLDQDRDGDSREDGEDSSLET